MSLMENKLSALWLVVIFAFWANVSLAQNLSEHPYESANQPNCGANSAFQWPDSGWSCVKYVIFPQYAVSTIPQATWTTQGLGTVPPMNPMASGQIPAVEIAFYPGYYATGGGGDPTLRLVEASQGISEVFATIVFAGGFHIWNFTGIDACSATVAGQCAPATASAQGPMYASIMAPDLPTLQAVSLQMSYAYHDSQNDWLVNVPSWDSQTAKASWSAPVDTLEGAGISVVNMDSTGKAVPMVKITDGNGNILYSKSIPTALAPAIVDSFAPTETQPGGFYAFTVTDLFGNITGPGQVEIDSSGPIMVIVLRAKNHALGSIPASPFTAPSNQAVVPKP